MLNASSSFESRHFSVRIGTHFAFCLDFGVCFDSGISIFLCNKSNHVVVFTFLIFHPFLEFVFKVWSLCVGVRGSCCVHLRSRNFLYFGQTFHLRFLTISQWHFLLLSFAHLLSMNEQFLRVFFLLDTKNDVID